jgi:hypothetical protein
MVRCSGGAAAGIRRPAGCSGRVARDSARGGTARGTSAPSCHRLRGPAAGAPRWVCQQVGGRRGAGGAIGACSGPGARLEDGGVAGAVAGVAGVPAGLDQPRVCRAYPRLPGPAPGRHRAGAAGPCTPGPRRAEARYRTMPGADGSYRGSRANNEQPSVIVLAARRGSMSQRMSAIRMRRRRGRRWDSIALAAESLGAGGCCCALRSS